MTGHLYDNGRVIAEYNDNDTVTTQYVHGSGLGGDVGSMIRSQSLTADTDNDGEADKKKGTAPFLLTPEDESP
ncbi:MAG: hypothetical protein AB1454_13315 [Candidatus Auribacterota bacterium]